jgi:dTDP-glucose 4,6-dehydratase
MTSIQRVGQVDVIFHLAALASVGRCERRPEVARLTNFQGTINLLNTALEMYPMPRFVHVSTAALYGEARYLPIDEMHEIEPRDQYTGSKLSAEITVAAYNKNQGLPTVIIRPFNVYGPRQDTEFVIPSIIVQCLQGIEVRLGDGRPVRNFTYVSDAVDMLMRAAVSPNAEGSVVNLGSRQSYSIADVANIAVELTGCGLEPIYDPARFREGDPTVLEMDPRLAEDLLGWRPKIWLHDGLRHTIEFFKARVEAEKARVAREVYGAYPTG